MDQVDASALNRRRNAPADLAAFLQYLQPDDEALRPLALSIAEDLLPLVEEHLPGEGAFRTAIELIRAGASGSELSETMAKAAQAADRAHHETIWGCQYDCCWEGENRANWLATESAARGVIAAASGNPRIAFDHALLARRWAAEAAVWKAEADPEVQCWDKADDFLKALSRCDREMNGGPDQMMREELMNELDDLTNIALGTARGLLAALAFSAEKHRGQLRKGAEGSPYIDHPIQVAM